MSSDLAAVSFCPSGDRSPGGTTERRLKKGEEMQWDDLVSAGREAARNLTGAQWRLGDLALDVERGKHGKLKAYAEEIGVELATLRQYRRTAEAFPAESCSREQFSFKVAQTFAPLDDRLDLVTSRAWSVADARALVRERSDAAKRAKCEPVPDSDDAPEAPTPENTPPVNVRNDKGNVAPGLVVDAWKALSTVADKTLAATLFASNDPDFIRRLLHACDAALDRLGEP